MADDIKIIVRADVSSVRDAEKAIKRFEGANKTLGRSILEVANKTKQVTSGWQQANSLYKEGTLNAKALKAAQTQLARELAVLNGYTTANGKLNTQRALAELKAAQAARDNAKATEEAARAAKESADAHERTRQRYVAGAAAQARLREAQRDLSAAYRAGVINIDEYREALRRLNQENRGNVRGTNNLGVAMQQTGYQVGDFVVQVQSGQDPMVAFGQQATQLVGIMYLLPPATLAASRTILGLRVSVAALAMSLGIIIPIATAIGAAFMRMKSSNDEATQGAKRLDDRLKALKETLRDYAELQAAMKEGVSLNFKVATGGVEEAEEDLAAAQKRLDSIKKAMEITGFGSSQAKGLLALSEAFKSLFNVDEASKYEAALAEVAAARKTLADLEAKEADESQAQADLRLASLEKLVGAIEQEAKAQGEYYGKTASEQERLNSLRDLHNTLLEAGLTPSDHLYLKAVQYHSQMVANTESTAAMTSALEAAAVAQSSLANLGEDYEVQLAMVNAQITALEQGKNAEVAAFIEGERAKATSLYESSKAMAVQTDNVVALAEATLTFLEAMEALDALVAARSKLASINRPSSGAKAVDPAKEAKKAFDSLRASYDKTFASQLKVKKAQDTVNEAIKLNVVSATDGKSAMEAYKESLKDTKNPLLDMANTISGAFSDAFMSMVEGTKSVKDAFGDMVRVVIKKAFEMAVINPIINSIFGGVSGFNPLPSFGTTQANGGAWQGGSQIKAYANGGVVGGPTFFPMAGGKTGLMGEAGPEAIMPLKRGANGKLGVQAEGSSQGNVVVNQSFNFQANGDDSVKKLIAQAAPQIANMTQKQIMDSRRRGGSMKAAFG